MSIKQSIAALLILMSVSFSAAVNAGYWIEGYSNLRFPNDAAVDQHVKDEFNDTVPYNQPSYVKYVNCYFANGGSSGNGVCYRNNTGTATHIVSSYTYINGSICPVGEELIDGECKPAPPPPFCSLDSTQQQMRDFESSCFADGGSPTIICNDQVEPPDFRMSCDIEPPPPTGCEPGSPSFPGCLDDENKCDENHPDWDSRYNMCCSPENNYCDVPPPESCTIFSANYPACMGDNDIAPPSGGDLGDPSFPDGGDLGDPSFPDGGASGGDGSGSTSPNNPEPEVDNSSDELSAIKSMNSDLNAQLNDINNDMNKNQAETKSALDALKSSTDLNTQSVIDGANHVADAVNGQSDMLSAIDNKTNQHLQSINGLLNNGFGELVNGLDGLQSGFDGLVNTNQQGFGDVIEAIEGLGSPTIENGLGGDAVGLYQGDKLAALNDEVELLKTEYQEVLDQYRNYFSINTSVNSGQYVAHDISLNWHGTAINKSNQVMASLQDNAGIISAVVLFVFGFLGIRAIAGSF